MFLRFFTFNESLTATPSAYLTRSTLFLMKDIILPAAGILPL
jgi:hypothetical protein